VTSELRKEPMPTIGFTASTTTTPEQFVAALIDFGPGRSGRTLTVGPEADRTTQLDVAVVRDCKDLEGRLLMAGSRNVMCTL